MDEDGAMVGEAIVAWAAEQGLVASSSASASASASASYSNKKATGVEIAVGNDMR